MPSVKATIQETRYGAYQTCPMILLLDVYIDGKFFRDHCWVKWSKRLADFKRKDVIHFTAEIRDYLSSEGVKQGLFKLRNITLL